MRNLILTILACWLTLASTAQNLGREGRESRPPETVAVPDSSKDTEEDIVIESVIKVWTLENEYSKQSFTNVDTATLGFNNYNPIFQKSISNTYLGYMGSSYQSNIYFDRTQNSKFYFLRNFDAYRLNSHQVRYYNTTTPYASLMYEEGRQGSSSSKEQEFKAFFTQNIDSISNFGFSFNAIKVPGQYPLQLAKHNFLNVFASRNGERLNSYFNLINGSDAINENGGIRDTTMNRYENMTLLNRYIIPVRRDPLKNITRLSKALENTSKSFSIFTTHEYLMGQIPFFIDSLDIDSTNTKFTPRYSVQYSLEYESNTRIVNETSDYSNFFDNNFTDDVPYTDSSSFNRFSQILQLKAFANEKRKFTFGKRAFIENEIVAAKHPLPDGNRKYSYSNIFVGAEIYRDSSSWLKWNALGRFAVLGRNIGDAILKGTASMNLILWNDTTTLSAAAWYQDQSPDIFQEHWYSKHFKWENSFKKQHELAIQGVLTYPKYKLNAGVNYALLSNYLYNNTNAMPDQYGGEFSILSASLNKDIMLGRFGWTNKIVWQGVSNDAVLHLPAWSIYSSVFYSHYLFKVMKLQLGAEIYYHSKFKTDSYEPSTTQFYLQNDLLTGGYPLINLYVNAKLARTSAFAELYHANSMLKMGEFFSSPGYPLDQMAFRFGFYWTFYD